MKVLIRSISGMLLGGMLLTTAVQAQDGEALFQQCTACHTIGGGRLVGPDLAGVNYNRSEEWLVKFIQSSQTLIKSGDAEAVAVYNDYNKMMMPDQAVSDAEAKAIIAHIASLSPEPIAADESTTEAVAEVVVEEVVFTNEDVAMGKALFEGEQRFENGGVTCISCHNVAVDGMIPGGLLAADLTEAYSRLGGLPAIKGILASPPFPAMRVSYEEHALTEEEIHQLQAFLKWSDENRIYQNAPNHGSILTYGGLTVFLTILLIITWLWHYRKTQHVKKEIYDRQLKSNR